MVRNLGIIGSGIAGLATAARLAAAGYGVTVFEARAGAGGKIGTTGNHRYRFDSGPSLFTLPHLLDEVFTYCGKDPRNYYHYSRKEMACRYFWDDGTRLTAWADIKRFAAEVEEKFGVEFEVLLNYLGMARHIYKTTAPVFLERSLHRWKNYFGRDTLQALGQLHKLHLGGNLHSLNAKKLKHPRLVQLFDRFATYNGSSPFLTPGVMSSISHLEHHGGTYFPRGGMHQIIKSLFQLCGDMGVKFHFSEPVEKIAVEHKKAKGLHTANGFYAFDAIISNIDIVPTYHKLMPGLRAPVKTLQQPRSSSAVIFYWGIKKQFSQLDLHNIFFSNNYRAEFEAIFKHKTISNDPTVYLNISAKEEEKDAPRGCENWFVMINAPGNTGQNWEALTARLRQVVLEKLNGVLNCNLENLIDYEEIRDPRHLESETGSYQGSLYGASSNNLMAAFLRHPNFSRQVKDLYFCGGSVHPGGGIPLCLLGARITAGIVNEHSRPK